MADTAQVIYEHTAGNTISFFTENLKITYVRHFLKIVPRPDGNLFVSDPTVPQRNFTCSGIIDGDELNQMNTWLMAAITYSGSYPRLTTINLDGDTTLSNVEVAITAFSVKDLGAGQWMATVAFTEKDL